MRTHFQLQDQPSFLSSHCLRFQKLQYGDVACLYAVIIENGFIEFEEAGISVGFF